ncbi:uncharacterized protein DDB_G0284459-like [Procambarus clarkii]|uniref:uncharacterized protein DDB_G0284459-like n=1 Tax=Procambarus clarkii TaxID=6728 RepID=UPI003742A14A
MSQPSSDASAQVNILIAIAARYARNNPHLFATIINKLLKANNLPTVITPNDAFSSNPEQSSQPQSSLHQPPVSEPTTNDATNVMQSTTNSTVPLTTSQVPRPNHLTQTHHVKVAVRDNPSTLHINGNGCHHHGKPEHPVNSRIIPTSPAPSDYSSSTNESFDIHIEDSEEEPSLQQEAPTATLPANSVHRPAATQVTNAAVDDERTSEEEHEDEQEHVEEEEEEYVDDEGAEEEDEAQKREEGEETECNRGTEKAHQSRGMKSEQTTGGNKHQKNKRDRSPIKTRQSCAR